MKVAISAFLLVFIFSCSKVHVQDAAGGNIGIDSTYNSSSLDSLYRPYQESMEKEMDVVIGHADTSFTKFEPESPLGDLVADIVYESGQQYMNQTKALGPDLSPVMSLINFGGLRATINEGDITRGDIYSLMPFDNLITIVVLEPNQVKEMLDYIFNAGGQPVANCTMQLSSNVQRLYFEDKLYEFDVPVYVITSDYLAGGGDKMDFFKDNPKTYNSGILIRDAIIDYVLEKKTLKGGYELNRLHFIRY